MPQTRLTIGSMAATVQLRVRDSILGVRQDFINLTSDDGKWKIKVPRAQFANMMTAEDDLLLVSLTLTRIVIEEEPDLPGLGSHKIILPEGSQH
jgi:hypothetical protein